MNIFILGIILAIILGLGFTGGIIFLIIYLINKNNNKK